MKSILSCISPAIFIAGGVLRICGTGRAALWHDEAVTLYRARLPLLELVNNNSEQSGDLLLEMILRPLLHYNQSVWMLRLPSLLASLVCLWLVWQLMKRLEFSPLQTALASAMIAFTPGLLWMAQDARSYSLLTMFFLLGIWYILEANLPDMALSCGLMLYCHNTAPAFVLAVFVIALFLYPWKAREILLHAIPVGVVYIPQALLVLTNNDVNAAMLQPVPEMSIAWTLITIVQGFWASIHTDLATVFISLLILALTVGLVFHRIRAHGRLIPLMAFAVPLAVLGLVSIVANVFIYRTIMPLIIPFLLWLAWELGRGTKYRTIMSVLWICVVISGVGRYDPGDRGAGVDRISAEIRSQFRSGDVLMYTTQTVIPFDYYLSDLPHAYAPAPGSNYFLDPDGPPLISTTADPATASRLWVFLPDDLLLTQMERAYLASIVGDQAPVYKLTYMQTSPLLVYLIEH